MSVHVKRKGEWIDAPCYEVGDEILAMGDNPAVVTKIWTGEDGVPNISMHMALKRPLGFLPMKFELDLVAEISKAKEKALQEERCPECGLAPDMVNMVPVPDSVPPVKVLECSCKWGHKWNVKAKWSREDGAATACYPTREGDGQ